MAWALISGVKQVNGTSVLNLTPNAGDLVVGGIIDGFSGATTPTMTDGTNTYAQLDITHDVTDATTVQWSWTIAATSTTLSIAINGTSTSAGFQGSWAANYRNGTLPASNNDGHVTSSAVAGSTSADADTSGNITTTIDGDLIVGFITDAGNTATVTEYAVGTGYTLRSTMTNDPGGATAMTWAVEDKVQATAGAVAATWTGNTTATIIAMIAAFKPPVSATGTPVVRNFMLLGVGA